MFEKIIFATSVLSIVSADAVEGGERKQTQENRFQPRKNIQNGTREKKASLTAQADAPVRVKRKMLAVRAKPKANMEEEDEDRGYEANNSDEVMASPSKACCSHDEVPAKDRLPPSTHFTQDHGMYVVAGALLWKNMQSNLGYAISQRPPTISSQSPSDPVTLIGDYKDLEFEWDYGYRGCVGWRFGANSWDLSAEYTYFRDKAHGVQTRSPTGDVAPYDYLKGLTPDFFGADISQITSGIHFRYQVLDVVLQRPIFQTRSCLVRFLIGGRGAYIRQNWFTQYDQLGNNASISPYESVVNLWKYRAAGLKAGLNMQWYWGWGLSLRGLAAGASTIGFYEAKSTNIKVDYSQPVSGNQYVYGDVNPKSHRMIPSYQLSVGMQWRGGNRHGGLYVYADWEMNSFRDLHQQYNFAPKNYSEPVSGSISKDSVDIQGLTAGVGIEF